MLIEEAIERKISELFKDALTVSTFPVEIVGSRVAADAGAVKSDGAAAAAVYLAIACGVRANDAFSLSPVSFEISLALATREEIDPTGAAHEQTLEVLVDALQRLHDDPPAAAAELAVDGLSFGELRLGGSSGKQYDSDRAAWTETLTFSIRGSVIQKQKG